jgi:hypothetical protein
MLLWLGLHQFMTCCSKMMQGASNKHRDNCNDVATSRRHRREKIAAMTAPKADTPAIGPSVG